MKKTLLLLIAVLLIGCSTPSETTKNEKVEVVKKEAIQEVQKEEEVVDGTLIKLDEIYSSEQNEMSLSGYEFTDLIEPNEKADFYSYFENKNPDKSDFIMIYGNFKNLESDTINLDGFAFRVVINEKYNYSLQAIFEEGGTFSQLSYISPLQSKEIILFGEIPNEAIESLETIKLQFGYNNEYDNMFDSFDSKDNKVEFEL